MTPAPILVFLSYGLRQTVYWSSGS